MNGSDENKREFFRLKYPPRERPVLFIDGLEYWVYEISERGIKLMLPSHHDFKLGDKIEGTIRFNDGQSSPVSGEVVRLQPPAVVVGQLTGIEFARMLKEQVQLRNKYLGSDPME